MLSEKDHTSLIAQRYYHLVIFKSELYDSQDFFKDCGIKKNDTLTIQDDDKLKIYRAKYVTDIAYYSGEEDYSINKNGQSPFVYDILAIELKLQNSLIVGFPFKLLANILTGKLNQKASSIGNFMKPELDKLIRDGHTSGKDFTDGEFSCYFSGLILAITGEPNIRSVNLDGEKPLNSFLYKSVFQKLIDKDECILEQCSLKCTLEKTIDTNKVRKTRSNIHMDVHGNFKMYIHRDWKNIQNIAFFFNFLYKKKYLKKANHNPLTM